MKYNLFANTMNTDRINNLEEEELERALSIFSKDDETESMTIAEAIERDTKRQQENN